MKSNGARTEVPGVVYQITCQNPGCGHRFELRITPQNARILSEAIACPRCGRRGGFLKPDGKIGDKLFAAKLLFKVTGTGYGGLGASEESDSMSEVL
jgi:hypothetical protein